MKLTKKQLISKLKIGTIHLIDTYASKQTTKELKDLITYMENQEKELIAEVEEEKRWKMKNKMKKRKK